MLFQLRWIGVARYDFYTLFISTELIDSVMIFAALLRTGGLGLIVVFQGSVYTEFVYILSLLPLSSTERAYGLDSIYT